MRLPTMFDQNGASTILIVLFLPLLFHGGSTFLLTLPSSRSWHVSLHTKRPSTSTVQSTTNFQLQQPSHQLDFTALSILSASSKNSKNENDKDDEQVDDSLKKAFEQLESLTSRDIADDAEEVPDDSFFAGQMKRLEVQSEDLLADNDPMDDATPEEVELYKEMYQELSGGDDGMYQGVMKDLGGDVKSSTDKQVDTDAEVEALESITAVDEEGRDQLLKTAMSEALQEPQITKDVDLDSLTRDEELVRQINKVFDDASQKLIDSVEEMKREQAEFTKQRKEASAAALEEDQQRLIEAEGSVTSLISNVNKEAENVEMAMKQLEDAKSKMKEDPLLRVMDFRNAGIVKQSAFAGFLLFSIRAVVDLTMLGDVAGNSHAIAAAVQGGVALVCAIAFFVL